MGAAYGYRDARLVLRSAAGGRVFLSGLQLRARHCEHVENYELSPFVDIQPGRHVHWLERIIESLRAVQSAGCSDLDHAGGARCVLRCSRRAPVAESGYVPDSRSTPRPVAISDVPNPYCSPAVAHCPLARGNSSTVIPAL